MKELLVYRVESFDDNYNVLEEYEFTFLDDAKRMYNQLVDNLKHEYKNGNFNRHITLSEETIDKNDISTFEGLYSTFLQKEMLENQTYRFLFIEPGLIKTIDDLFSEDTFARFEEFEDDENDPDIGYFTDKANVFLTTKEEYTRTMDNPHLVDRLESNYEEYLLNEDSIKAKLEFKLNV